MRTFAVVVLALAAGIAHADAKTVKTETVVRMDGLVICNMETSCAWCNDKQCKHGGAIVCPKKGDCKKITWIRTPPKHVKLISKIPIIGLNGAAAPQSKLPGGNILDGGPGLGRNGPAAIGAAPSAPSAPPPPVLK